jgi:hypothetical protein
MKDKQQHLEKLRADAAECALIRDLAMRSGVMPVPPLSSDRDADGQETHRTNGDATR